MVEWGRTVDFQYSDMIAVGGEVEEGCRGEIGAGGRACRGEVA